jgi:putative ABC transport system permease protein
MNGLEIVRFSVRALTGHRRRSILVLLAMGIGVAAVVLLTSLGEGARLYIEGEFSSLGTHLLIVLPGRSETVGGPPPLLGETPRDLTLDDALALLRCPSVRRVAPVILGTAPVSVGSREREVPIFGSTHEFLGIRHMEMASGRFLPPGDPERALPVCVIGAKIRDELFGARSPLGEYVRIGDRRFQVIGQIGSRGQSLGADLDDMVTVPIASAQALFNAPSLFRILVEARSAADIEAARRCIIETTRERHDGEDDVTVITQDAVRTTFNRILGTLTISIAGITAVSLLVAGILIMNVCLVSVSERTAEIGLLKAVGAPRRTILAVFLAEGVALAASGGFAGLNIGLAGVAVLRTIYPKFPVTTPLWAPISALSIAIVSGLLFSILPASRAARLDPVLALGKR